MESRGAWRDCCMQDSPSWLWGSWSTSWGLETRVSRRQRCGLWVRRSYSPVWGFVYCVLPFVYLPSLAAVGGPTTRRTEDCPVAWKAKRCHLLAVPPAALHNARPRAGSTRLPATCRAFPVARKTSDCAGTEQQHISLYNRPHKLYRSHLARARHTLRYGRPRRRRVHSRRAGYPARPSQCQVPRKASKDPCRVHRKASYMGRASGGRRRGTYPSQAAQTGNLFSAPHNSDPNKQYRSQNDNDYAILRLCDSDRAFVLSDLYGKLQGLFARLDILANS